MQNPQIARMRGISLLVVDQRSGSSRPEVVQHTLDNAGFSHTDTCELQTAPSGKPLLRFADKRSVGYSVSYARSFTKTIKFTALIADSEIGLDAEFWPESESDQHFLASVASPEDRTFLDCIRQFGRDEGVALWVIKEAALKCSGDVSIDPRDLVVSALRKGRFRVRSSSGATLPQGETDVSLLIVSHPGSPRYPLLIGIALPTTPHSRHDVRPSVHLKPSDLQLFSFAEYFETVRERRP